MSSVDISAWGAEPPRWVQLLAAEVRASSRTRAARRIGMSTAAVSLALVNRYPSPSTAGVERRVLDALDGRACLVQDTTITVQECRSYRQRSVPTHNPLAMRQWLACRNCPHNPASDKGGDA